VSPVLGASGIDISTCGYFGTAMPLLLRQPPVVGDSISTGDFLGKPSVKISFHDGWLVGSTSLLLLA
jgi:hypothetical protein